MANSNDDDYQSMAAAAIEGASEKSTTGTSSGASAIRKINLLLVVTTALSAFMYLRFDLVTDTETFSAYDHEQIVHNAPQSLVSIEKLHRLLRSKGAPIVGSEEIAAAILEANQELPRSQRLTVDMYSIGPNNQGLIYVGD